MFIRSGATWSLQAELTVADGADDDQLGTSVALAGDTAVVGLAAPWPGGAIAGRQREAAVGDREQDGVGDATVITIGRSRSAHTSRHPRKRRW